jgi:hypothetical protein
VPCADDSAAAIRCQFGWARRAATVETRKFARARRARRGASPAGCGQSAPPGQATAERSSPRTRGPSPAGTRWMPAFAGMTKTGGRRGLFSPARLDASAFAKASADLSSTNDAREDLCPRILPSSVERRRIVRACSPEIHASTALVSDTLEARRGASPAGCGEPATPGQATAERSSPRTRGPSPAGTRWIPAFAGMTKTGGRRGLFAPARLDASPRLLGYDARP